MLGTWVLGGSVYLLLEVTVLLAWVPQHLNLLLNQGENRREVWPVRLLLRPAPLEDVSEVGVVGLLGQLEPLATQHDLD